MLINGIRVNLCCFVRVCVLRGLVYVCSSSMELWLPMALLIKDKRLMAHVWRLMKILTTTAVPSITTATVKTSNFKQIKTVQSVIERLKPKD